MQRKLLLVLACPIWALQCGSAQIAQGALQPIVAIHDSELTRALESMPAVPPTPSGPPYTGFQWFPPDWHYFVMPESVKEALRSDGTAFTVIGDSNITSGILLSNGVPRFPIVVSLTSEAIRDDEIAPLTNYVAAGGFLFVGGSAFTRNTNGTTRSDFAFGNAMGLHMVGNNLANWSYNQSIAKTLDHRIVSHFPAGQLMWRLPAESEEIPWGISPDHPYLSPHLAWRVTASDATVLAFGDDTYPFYTVKQYGNGYFIYCAAFQPFIGHGGFAPSMYTYVTLRRSIEWAFESAGLPIPKLSPWPYQYDAAFMIRRDLENYTNAIAAIATSAQMEFTNGARGDYYFCTGTLRDDAYPSYDTNSIVAALRQAVTNFGATIGPHNGGLKNPNNSALVRGQYDYWHWGSDEALDVTPTNYPSGKAYATASISNSFRDIESWLKGITNGVRSWCQCYFNGTREDSYDLQAQLGVKIAADQKLAPFPHWTLSTRTPNKRYSLLSEPVSDWFVVDTNTMQGSVAQSLEPWHPPGIHTTNTLRSGIDFYYNLGALINFYSHTLMTGLGDAGGLATDYVVYSLKTNLHPRLWSANGVLVYQWWLQRSSAQVSATYSTNGNQSLLTFTISGATHTNTSVELVLPGTNQICTVQVVTNGVRASADAYRMTGQKLKLLVGNSVTNAIVGYYPLVPTSQVFAENFDSVSAPALPNGWTTSSSGAQANWVTSTSTNFDAPNCAASPDAAKVGVNELVSPPIAMPLQRIGLLRFMQYYDLEQAAVSDAYDGAVLEIKIGTNDFVDILDAGGTFVCGGYNSNINGNFQNPLAGRSAWTGTSPGFVPALVNLPASAAGQLIQLKWRCATDNSNGHTGWRIDTITVSNQVCLCCNPTNNAPVLPSQTDRTINEFSTLVVTNTATDPDVPPETLLYRLVPPTPHGVAIDTNGVITWTPAQGPSTNTIATIVTDNGFPPLSATNSFVVVVNDINLPPVLPAQINRTINELSTMTVANTATDSNVPPATLTYTLLIGPTNAVISTNGIIKWTTLEGQGPGAYTFTTIVSNYNALASNDQSLSATNSFTVVVNDINLPPALPPQINRTIAPLTSLVVTNTASDPNLPPVSLTYALINPPTGASIDSNGIITWTPNSAQDQSTNLIRTVVTNFNPNAVNSQHLSATNSFTVVVNGRPLIVPDGTTLIAEGCIPTNNAIDPGEKVTVLVSLKNTGLGNTTNLVATLSSNSDTLSPSGPQTYGVLLSGGSDVSQPFTFTAGGACGNTINLNLQLQDGSLNLGTATVSFVLGPQITVLTQNFDTVTAPALPPGWTTFSVGAQTNWFTTNTLADTPPNAAFSADAANVGINELDSPSIALPNGPAQLSFRNSYALETDTLRATNGFDGGVLEIQIGTNNWADITNAGGTFVANGYNRKIDSRFGNPLTNRWAWSGTNSGYVTTTVNLPASAQGETVRFRWRVGTDLSNPGGGWRIDSISVTAYACCVPDTPPALPPVIQSIILSNSAVTLSWSSISGRTYRLEYKDNLAATDWNFVLPAIPASGNTTSATNYIEGNALRLYRITLLP